MKKGWEIKKLGDVCIVERGSSPRPIKDFITDDEDGVNWIKIGDTKNIEKYIYTTKQKITNKGAEKSRFVEEGDFILSNSMSFGKPYIIKTKGYIHDGWFKLKLHDFVNTEYFYQLLSSPLVNDQFHNLASGSVVKNISGDLVKKVILPIPPLPEQKRIVAILDKAFTSIASAKENAQQNLLNAKELFESYLQNVFENKGEDWEEKEIKDLTELVTKGSSPKWQGVNYVDEGGIYFLTSKNVGEGELLLNNKKYLQEKFNEIQKTSILKKGDILTNIVGASIGRTAIFNLDEITNINQAVCLMRCNSEKVYNYYLMYLLNSPFFKSILHDNEVDNARANLSLTFFKNLAIPLPNIKEQKIIVENIKSFSAETKKLEVIYQQKINDLEELKKSVLEKAFKGELKMVN
jgi:type I restriction enzyme S subunit